MKLSRGEVYRVVFAFKRPDLVGARIRPLLIDEHEVVAPNSNGQLEGLEALMLSGEWAGSVVALPPCELKLLSRRTCTCGAYGFPHAPGLGQCKSTEFEQTAPVGMTLAGLWSKQT